jgi:hypothetical protein
MTTFTLLTTTAVTISTADALHIIALVFDDFPVDRNRPAFALTRRPRPNGRRKGAVAHVVRRRNGVGEHGRPSGTTHGFVMVAAREETNSSPSCGQRLGANLLQGSDGVLLLVLVEVAITEVEVATVHAPGHPVAGLLLREVSMRIAGVTDV